jgi:hypothetical protein
MLKKKGILGSDYFKFLSKSGVLDWTPGELNSTQMAQWIDATDESTVTTATGISQIDDKSGNGFNATQSTGSDQPDYIDGSAGYKAIDFSSPINGVLNLGQPINNSNCLVFAVWKESATDFIPINESTGAYTMVATQSNASTSINAGSGTPVYYKNGNLSSPTTRGDLYDLYGGDVLVISEQREVDFSAWIGNWTLGNYSSTRDLEGEFYEHIIIDGDEVTTEDVLRVEGYLAHKYGLEASLPLGHPYRSSAPTVNAPNFSPYLLEPLTWLDASEEAAITLNGSDIVQIDGVDSNGESFTQGTAPDQPGYDEVNDSMVFAGSENIATTNKALFNTLHESAGAIGIKVKLADANSDTLQPIFSTASNTGSSKGVFLSIDDRAIVGTNRVSLGVSNGSGGSGAFAYLTRSSSDFSLGDSDVTDYFTIIVEWDGTDAKAYKNNVLLGTQTIQTTLGTGDSSLDPIIGEASADNFSGELGDVVIVDRKLTSEERTNLHNYLMNN